MRLQRCVIAALALTVALAGLAGCGKKNEEEVRQYIKTEEAGRAAKDKWMAAGADSPLLPEKRAGFQGLSYYPVDPAFRVKANFENIVKGEEFVIQTSTEETRVYVKTGRLTFTLNGKKLTLMAYQDRSLLYAQGYGDKLFVPFADATSGRETYGGGRYLDLIRPGGNSVVIDFNLAYNPYCAYNPSYSCPIPPPENRLNVAITAGEKNFHK